MKNRLLILVMALILIGGAGYAQTIDTNVISKSGLPKENGKTAFITNAKKIICNGDTIGIKEASIRFVYDYSNNKNVVVTSMPKITKSGIDTTFISNFPDSSKSRAYMSILGRPEVTTHLYIDTVSYKDTLSAGTTSVTYSFGRQYPRLELSVKYDSTSVANDTLRLYNIGNRGDTTDIYVLDSAGNRLNYIINSGDCKFKKWRVDEYCPENVMVSYSDAVIFTTKFIIIPKAIKY